MKLWTQQLHVNNDNICQDCKSLNWRLLFTQSLFVVLIARFLSCGLIEANVYLVFALPFIFVIRCTTPHIADLFLTHLGVYQINKIFVLINKKSSKFSLIMCQFNKLIFKFYFILIVILVRVSVICDDESVSNGTTSVLELLVRGSAACCVSFVHRNTVQPLAYDSRRMSRRLLWEHKLRLYFVWSEHIPVLQWWP